MRSTNRSTPVEKFNLIDEDEDADGVTWEERRNRKRRKAMMAAIATAVGLLFLGFIIVGGAAMLTNGGELHRNCR